MAASDKSESVLRGLGTLDPRLVESNLWTAQSSFTQAGPLPGVPVPQRDSELVLMTTGSQAASDQLRIQIKRGGLPGIGDAAGGFIWQKEGDTNWMGWDVPTTISAWGIVDWVDGTLVAAKEAQCITLSNGDILAIYYRETSGSYGVGVRTRSAASNTWGSFTTLYTMSAANSDGSWPYLVELPTGRILAFMWSEDTTANTYQLRVYYSDDSGGTWTLATSAALATPIDVSGASGSGVAGYDPRRFSIAYNRGDLCMVAHLIAHDTDLNFEDLLIQLKSNDLGMSFDQVALWTGANEGGGYPAVIASNGIFQLYYHERRSGGNGIVRLTAGAAGIDFQNSSAVYVTPTNDPIGATGNGAISVNSSFTMVKADGGAFYAFVMNVYDVSNSYGLVATSSDDGLTWANMGQSSRSVLESENNQFSTFFDFNVGDCGPLNMRGTWASGRAVILTNWRADPGNEDNSLGVLYMGGYSDLTLPGYTAYNTELSRVSWDGTWLPWDLPAESTWWTATVVGAPTYELDDGRMEITSTTGNTVYWTRATSPVALAQANGGIMIMASLQIASGGSASTNRIAIRIRATDTDSGPSHGATVSIRFTTTSIICLDEVAASTIGTITTDTSTTGVDIIAQVSGTTFRSWYRTRGTGPDRTWTAGPATTSLSDDSGAGGTPFIVWGHPVDGAAVSYWYQFNYVTGAYTGEGLTGGFTNPADLFPRAVSPNPTGVTGGVNIKAMDGPGFPGDEFDIDTRYSYEWTRMLPTVDASPRTRWRSTADAVEQTIAIQLPGHGGSGTSLLGSDSICLYLDGCNWRLGSLEGWNGSAWVAIFTIDLATDMAALPYTRTGDGVTVDTGTAHVGARFIKDSEFEDATVVLKPGAGVPIADKYRKIARQTAGTWRNTTTLHPEFILEGMDNTEPSSGTLEVWAKRGVVIHHLKGTRYGGYRLKIDAQTTYEGYYTVGTFFVGPLAVFGYQPGWDRTRDRAPNVDVQTFTDGSRVARRLGPPRTTVAVAWTDGVDLTNVQGREPDPNYVTGRAVGGQPLATRVGAPLLLEGLIAATDGPRIPVVYLPLIPRDTDTIKMIFTHAFLYGRITSAYRQTVVQGDEMTDEVVRVANVTISGEV